jgi:hypothetical protein
LEHFELNVVGIGVEFTRFFMGKFSESLCRWKMKDERWKMKDERWKMKDERWKMKDERWKMKQHLNFQLAPTNLPLPSNTSLKRKLIQESMLYNNFTNLKIPTDAKKFKWISKYFTVFFIKLNDFHSMICEGLGGIYRGRNFKFSGFNLFERWF